MKIRRIILSLMTTLSLASVSLQSFPQIDAYASETESYGIVTYDALTGVETYHNGFESANSSTASLASNTLVMEKPEIRVDNQITQTEMSDLVTPLEIIGTDTRTEIDVPKNYGQYRNTCRLKIITSTGQEAIGTGFVLSNSAIITAGHNLYDYDVTKAWVKSVTVIPAYDEGSAPYGSVTGTSFSCGSGWKNSGTVGEDWGIIHVNNTFVDKCGSLGLRYQEASYVGLYVTVAGYPKVIRNSSNVNIYVNGDQMYGASSAVTGNTSSIVYYGSLDTSGGQSGSPVVRYYTDTGYTAIAIHHGVFNSTNCGVRISQWLYNNFMSLL